MKKYPRTPHLPFSPGVQSDDKIIPAKYLKNFLNKRIIATEKMDGQNQTFKGHRGIYARSHEIETQLPWDSYAKSYYYNNMHLIDPNIWYIFENMFAVHSIEYENLDSYMYMFTALIENEKRWASWDEVEELAKSINMKTAPVLYDGVFSSLKEIEDWMSERIKGQSSFGSKIEGFVLRPAESFPMDKFNENVVKYVRAGHVQTDEHWTRNWEKAKLKNG